MDKPIPYASKIIIVFWPIQIQNTINLEDICLWANEHREFEEDGKEALFCSATQT